MEITLGQQYNVGEKPTVILCIYTYYINRYTGTPEKTVNQNRDNVVHHHIDKRIVLMSTIVPSNHTRIGAWVNSKMSGRNPIVYCTIPLNVMQGYHTNTEYTGS